MIRKGKREGFFWFGIGMIICILGWKIGLGSFQEPGSGFIAFLSGLLICILGLLIVLPKESPKSLLEAHSGFRRAFRGAPVFLLLLTVGVLLGYGIFLEILGYNLTTFLVMWALFYLFYEKGKRRIVWSALASFATAGVTYLVFEVWLRSQLPRGIFPWW